MTREELATAARDAHQEADGHWYDPDDLRWLLGSEAAEFIAQTPPSVVLELLTEIDELRSALERVAVMARDQRYLRRDVREVVDAALDKDAA